MATVNPVSETNELTSKQLKLFYSDTFELPLPADHRFPMAKYRLLRERLQLTGNGRFQFLLPPSATDEQLLLVHTPEYLQAIKSGELTKLQIRRIGFPWSEKMVERSRRSTGASIAAGQAALQEGIAANLAGGTHHSFPDSGQGFCVFNDACVAARVLQQHEGLRNVMIVDCDVHQGNGTAFVAVQDESLFSFSMHCEKNYPFKKTDGDLDIALPEKTKDSRYLTELERGLDSAWDRFHADLVFYIAGADPFAGDRLGLLSLSKEGLKQRDQIVLEFFRSRDIPVAVAMGGGYAPDLEDIVHIHSQTIMTCGEFFGQPRPFDDRSIGNR